MSKKPVTLRQLTFNHLDDILNDVIALSEAANIKVGGQWTAAQNIDHIRRTMILAREGTDVKAPFFLRFLGRFLKGGVGKKAIPSGFKIPPQLAAVFAPSADITLQDAVEKFKTEIALIKVPGSMNKPSPVFGKMTHQRWEQLHLRHAELHLGFLAPE